jgi:hypothetical protein
MPFGTPTDQSQYARYTLRARYGQSEIFAFVQLEDGNSAASEAAKDVAWQALADLVAGGGASGWALVTAEKTYDTTEPLTPTET